ncbi:MAG: DNA-directed RNA polymerase, partial [Promethearchaeia archaeon]
AFYFPHNLDFRGRAYPIPPHLNHLGSDICRGLLKFAEKKPLGAKGLYWLKVHLANLFGINKVSFDDRVAWTDQRLHMIHLAAEQPLSEAAREWWLRADEPWQALASCMELSEAIQSGSPETFLSNLPVHQDGSCNGLQHYAAMGLDVIGGEQVNLTPGDKPSDPYTTVCNRVIQVIQTGACILCCAEPRLCSLGVLRFGLGFGSGAGYSFSDLVTKCTWQHSHRTF